MVRKHGGQSLAVVTFERLQRAILAGQFSSGERLLPSELALEHGVSTSVVREALIRLSEKGLVEVAPNQGFTVVRASVDRIHDLIEVRVVNETAALRLSIERGDIEWESSVVAAHHRMASLQADSASDRDRWFVAHLAFHEALIAGCRNEFLTNLCAELLRTGDLYLRWSGRRAADPNGWTVVSERDLAVEHASILEAVLHRDADLAAARYEEHLRLTGSLIEAGEHDQADSRPPASPAHATTATRS